MPPGKHVAVVACMDARLNPYGLLGLQEGDAHVIRNAGGMVTADEIRSLAISQRLLGTREIMLIHHTDCGMLTFSDEQTSSVSMVRPAPDPQRSVDLSRTTEMALERLRPTLAAPEAAPAPRSHR
jgi:carbonic anhydrase